MPKNRYYNLAPIPHPFLSAPESSGFPIVFRSFRSVFLCLVGRTDLIEHHSDSFWHHFAEPVIPNTWTQEKRNSMDGVIEESHSDWSRVAVIVLKQDCAWIVTS